MIVGAARRSLGDQGECGDAFAWWRDGDIWTVCLVDGLGHGAEAARAANMALAYASHARASGPVATMAAINSGLHETRGAAVALIQTDVTGRKLTYAGVGNVRGALFGDPVLRFESAPGIVGAHTKSMRSENVTWSEGDLFILWTDGFGSQLNLDMPFLRLRSDPVALAAKLLAERATGRDDAGIVCCRLSADIPP